MTNQWMGQAAVHGLSAILALGVALFVIRRWRSVPAFAPGLLVVMIGIIGWSAVSLAVRIAPTHEMRAAFLPGFALALPVLVTGYYFSARGLTDVTYRPGPLSLIVHLGNIAVVAAALAIPSARVQLAGYVVHTRGYELGWHPGPWFWVEVGLCFVGWCAATSIDLRGLADNGTTHRNIIWCHIGGAVVPLMCFAILFGYMATHGGWMHTKIPDYSPLGFIATSAVNLYAVRNQNMLTVSPVARGVILQELTDAIFIFDRGGFLVDRNSAAEDLLARCGFRSKNLTAEHRFTDIILRLGPEVRAENGEYPIASVPPSEVDLRVSDVVSEGRVIARSLVVRDVTGVARQRRELAQANSQLRDQLTTIEALRNELLDQANRDSLTGVPNRRSLETALADLHHDSVLAGRGGRYSLAVVDIDHFKAVNDTYGHLVGDEILVAVAGYLSSATSGLEQVYRFGGEEFVVLMPGAGRATALARATAYAAACRHRDIGSVTGVNLTTSIGVATFPDDGAGTTAVLAAADTALYEAKETGRNKVVQAALARVAEPHTP